MKNYDVIIVGGGAAGFFTAINIAENDPQRRILILERGNEVLTKVRISGGGRCNLTHAEFDPKSLSQNYPRGEKELLGPFHSFMTGDTIEWFEKRGVTLKIESDGRMFPISDSSQTIIDCFLSESERLGITIKKNCRVEDVSQSDDYWKIFTSEGEFETNAVVMTTGSNLKIWKMLKKLGHSIDAPVPSLFTFKCADSRIQELPGLAVDAFVEVLDDRQKSILQSDGPLLITHWGMSGPAILKLSAWGAHVLASMNYKFRIRVNWLLDASEERIIEALKLLKAENPKQTIVKYAHFNLPKRLWQNLVRASDIENDLKWSDVTRVQLQRLAIELGHGIYDISGKSTFKDEFVTAGGINLKEVNFKTFESKLFPNLYFAGEVLNIDAITGGFNFQNAWTGGFMVAKSITSEK